MQREKYVAVWLRMLAQKEIGAARNAKKILKAQGKSIATAFEKSGQSSVEQILKEGTQDWIRLLVANYAATIRDFSRFIKDQLNLSNTKAGFMDAAQAFIARESFKKSTLITRTTIDKAQNIISNGFKEGKGEKEIAKELEEHIGGAVADSRAATIARTETHNAATFAIQETAEDSGVPMMREWVAIEDSRTRESHAEANGQLRELDEPFDVGGEEIDRPGEGSDENSINCRCAIAYTPKELASIQGDNSGDFINE